MDAPGRRGATGDATPTGTIDVTGFGQVVVSTSDYRGYVVANRMHPFPQEHENDEELPMSSRNPASASPASRTCASGEVIEGFEPPEWRAQWRAAP
jgi:hypothetical protein